jgi:hypothetical protein
MGELVDRDRPSDAAGGRLIFLAIQPDLGGYAKNFCIMLPSLALIEVFFYYYFLSVVIWNKISNLGDRPFLVYFYSP